MNAKRKLLIAVLTVLGVSLLVAGTLAARQYTAYNDVHTGQIDVLLNETVCIEQEVLPGEKLTHPVSVNNPSGSGDSYIRVKVAKSFDDNTLDTGYIILTMSGNEKWTLEEDGYYYYEDCVLSGTDTEPLFSGIEFDRQMGNEYSGHKATVTITAEAIQAKNNATNPWGLNAGKGEA